MYAIIWFTFKHLFWFSSQSFLSYKLPPNYSLWPSVNHHLKSVFVGWFQYCGEICIKPAQFPLVNQWSSSRPYLRIRQTEKKKRIKSQPFSISLTPKIMLAVIQLLSSFVTHALRLRSLGQGLYICLGIFNVMSSIAPALDGRWYLKWADGNNYSLLVLHMQLQFTLSVLQESNMYKTSDFILRLK